MNINADTIIKKGQPSEEIISEARNYDLLIVGIKKESSNKKLNRIANKLLNSHTTSTVFVQ
jgi:nucleotide-binding universal stress UspA family protein